MTSAAGAPPMSCSGLSGLGVVLGPCRCAATARAPKLDRAAATWSGWAAAGQPPLPRRPSGRRAPGHHCPQPPGHRLAARRGRVDQRGAPTLTWHFDQTALEREQATDGWYGLLTNLDPGHADAAGVLARYQGQEVVERRYGAFKGPLAVAPMFVQSNRRIQALSP
jgi:hypothetical protein